MRKKSHDQEVIEIQANYFLETLGMCQELHVLPRPGGLHDQDSMFVHLMKFALVYQHERRELDNHKASRKARTK